MVFVGKKTANMLPSQLGLERLLEEIYFLRLHLNELSRGMDSLSHPTLVEVSQMLDEKLNDYNQLACNSNQQGKEGLTLMG